jgi:hypothetical protein
MNEFDPTDSLERDVVNLRLALTETDVLPLGIVSRLEAGLVRASRDDTPVGWEPRIVVACVAFAVLTAAAPALTGSGFAPLVAAAALGYAWLASWPSARERR